jgi:hypothetical protein
MKQPAHVVVVQARTLLGVRMMAATNVGLATNLAAHQSLKGTGVHRKENRL